jgi:curved DNA-binding protein
MLIFNPYSGRAVVRGRFEPLMPERDFYQILGVPRTATAKEIRTAYRNLARKYHPDRNPGNKEAEERFKDASFASEVLLDTDKRKLYDEFGEIGLREGFNAEAYRQYARHGQGAPAGPAGGGGFGGGGFGGLEDLFEQIAGRRGGASWSGSLEDLFGGAATARGGRQAREHAKPPDVTAEVTISFADAVRGSERELSLQFPGGEARSIKVRIPAGVRDGGRIRLRGQGPNGADLVLTVHVQEHPFFRREGNDLLLDLPVTVAEAYRGARVQVPTPDGLVTLRIPARVRGGSKLRLRGRGVRMGSEVGDLIVEVEVVLPDEDGLDPSIDAIEAAYKEPVRKDLSF